MEPGPTPATTLPGAHDDRGHSQTLGDILGANFVTNANVTLSQETFEALSGVPIADAQVAQALGHTPSRFAVWQCVLGHEALSVATELSRVAIVSRALRQVTIYLSFGSYRLYRTF